MNRTEASAALLLLGFRPRYPDLAMRSAAIYRYGSYVDPYTITVSFSFVAEVTVGLVSMYCNIPGQKGNVASHPGKIWEKFYDYEQLLTYVVETINAIKTPTENTHEQ